MAIDFLVLNVLVLLALAISFFKSREKTSKVIKIAFKSLINTAPYIIITIIIIGIMQGFIPNRLIAEYLGEKSGISGVLLASLIGAILYIPAFVSFPLVASLIEKGASVMIGAAFITSLTMIGFTSLPLEIKEFGIKFTVLRNISSFAAAILIAVAIGVLL
ncbi:MAG TPA: permease [Candidatus Methanofastidiosum sp.]|jgi:uncharacterized membrane protein YraQ (UPF0718 family)|nr:permease [Methanofastidiosum sp.]